ncbi:hypothetical protein, partial [Paenibacillus elgii]|uniref:hypothetical protein n=1 Tax=Paenibacillus elgii TaxID=189691 RepID=UPI00203C9A1C
LMKIKDTLFVRDALLRLGLDGVAFYYYESNESKHLNGFLSDIDIDAITEINSDFNCSMITLPTDYCKIIGMKNSSYLVAFNLSYFDQFTSNGRSKKLISYPKEIRDGYKRYLVDRSKKWLVLDNNRTITIKVRSNQDEVWGRPTGLAAFVDILYDIYFMDTKRNKLDEVNNTVVYQTFPEGESKGKSSLTQNQQSEQHNNIRNALFSRSNKHGVSFFSVAAGTKLDKITTDIEILKVDFQDEINKRISTDLGFAGSAINGFEGNYSSQQTNIDLVTSVVFTWIEQIATEMNKVINANTIKDKNCYVQVYYLPVTFANRKEMVSNMKELYTQGRGSLMAWIASTGINTDAYLALMDYEKEENFEEKYPVHMISYTMSKQDQGSEGRPSEDNPTNSNTIAAKTKNKNANPRPSDR